MKKNIILLFLNIICFIMVLVGSFIDDFNSFLNIVICVIIFISIIVQVIAILNDRKNVS